MANYSFLCRESKVSPKTGMAPIELSIVLNGKRTYIALPRKIKPSELKKNQEYLDAVRVKLLELETEMMKAGIALTADAIKHYFKQGFVTKLFTIADIGKEYLDIVDARGDLSTVSKNRYHKTWETFLEIIALDPNLPATTITPKHIELFKAELYKRMAPVTASNYLKKVKAVFRYAFESGRLSSNPFVNIKIPRAVSKKVRFLQPLELERLRVVRLHSKRLEQVRDCFLVSAGSGLSFSDLAKIKPEDYKVSELRQLYVTGNRNKTDVGYTAIFLDDAAEIVRNYNYRLPIISNQKTNAFLKEIATLADIETNLTFHVARHTFTYRLLNELELPEETIMKMCGWRNTSMVHYYARLMDSTIFKQVRRVQNRKVIDRLSKGD